MTLDALDVTLEAFDVTLEELRQACLEWEGGGRWSARKCLRQLLFTFGQSASWAVRQKVFFIEAAPQPRVLWEP